VQVLEAGRDRHRFAAGVIGHSVASQSPGVQTPGRPQTSHVQADRARQRDRFLDGVLGRSIYILAVPIQAEGAYFVLT